MSDATLTSRTIDIQVAHGGSTFDLVGTVTILDDTFGLVTATLGDTEIAVARPWRTLHRVWASNKRLLWQR